MNRMNLRPLLNREIYRAWKKSPSPSEWRSFRCCLILEGNEFPPLFAWFPASGIYRDLPLRRIYLTF